MRPLATPAALASQGFYFKPPEEEGKDRTRANEQLKDRVICAFCNLELSEWGPKDDPVREHSRRAAHCPVVTGQVWAVQAKDPGMWMCVM